MAARILRIELRRSTALWFAALIAAVGVFVLFASNEPYRSWMHLVIVQRDIMQLTWPLALAAGAWQGIRDRRSRVEELLSTTSRPRWQRVLPLAAAMAIGATLGYLVMLAGSSGHLRHIDAYFPIGAIPLIALGAVAMVAAVWLGLAIGTMVPSPLTAPMLAVFGFLGLAVSPMLVARDSRYPGIFLLFPYLQGPRDGLFDIQVLSARANLSQALWLATLAATGLALFAAARPRTRVAALLPAVIGAAIAVPAMPAQLSSAWVEDRRATAMICTHDEPRVCLARAYSYLLDDLRDPARQALSILAAKLPPAPTRILVESADKNPDPVPPRDTLVLRISAFEDIELYSSEELVALMLDGAGVPPCEKLLGPDPDQPDPRYLGARQAVNAWLLDRRPPPAAGPREAPETTVARQAFDTLTALPLAEQRDRVAAWREAERACSDADRLELLVGPDEQR